MGGSLVPGGGEKVGGGVWGGGGGGSRGGMGARTGGEEGERAAETTAQWMTHKTRDSNHISKESSS